MPTNSELEVAITAAVGKTICAAIIDPESDLDVWSGQVPSLRLTFTDGSVLVLWDDGQDCCETRYMSTDDDLTHMQGAVFSGVDVKDAFVKDDTEGDVHECQFADILTNIGVFTLVNHNKNNGYYGGFRLQATYKEEGVA